MQIVENSFFNCVSFHLALEMAFLVLVHSRNRPFRFRRSSCMLVRYHLMYMHIIWNAIFEMRKLG